MVKDESPAHATIRAAEIKGKNFDGSLLRFYNSQGTKSNPVGIGLLVLTSKGYWTWLYTGSLLTSLSKSQASPDSSVDAAGSDLSGALKDFGKDAVLIKVFAFTPTTLASRIFRLLDSLITKVQDIVPEDMPGRTEFMENGVETIYFNPDSSPEQRRLIFHASRIERETSKKEWEFCMYYNSEILVQKAISE